MNRRESDLRLTEHPTLSSGLLNGVQRMDPDSWSRLVGTFGPIVYRWCRTAGLKQGDIPDVVQDVFTSVARGIPDFQPAKARGSFRSWLATITRNRIRDEFRRQAKRHAAEGGTDALVRLQQQAEQLDDTITLESIQSPLVRQVLERVRVDFEPLTWQAFLMSAIDGKSAAEVADATGLSTASVYQAKSRVLRRLRHAMAQLP